MPPLVAAVNWKTQSFSAFAVPSAGAWKRREKAQHGTGFGESAGQTLNGFHQAKRRGVPGQTVVLVARM